MSSPRIVDIDFSQMSLSELRKLVSRAERILELRKFEEGLSKAVREFKTRDPGVIRM